MEMIVIIASALGGICLGYCLPRDSRVASIFGGVQTSSLPDHDLSENRVTATSTVWQHSHVCGACFEKIGHDEWMTKICLSCGRDNRSGLFPPNGAWRRVVFSGKWTDHLRVNGRDYLRQSGKMVLASTIKSETE